MTTFAYAPALAEDEPLDGWLERIAQVVTARPAEILGPHGLRVAQSHRPIRDFKSDDIARLSDLTSVDTTLLWRATLHRWQRLGLTPDKSQRGHQGGAWAGSSVARFCPDCVGEREGVHRLQWRVIWSFACVRHARLLTDYGPRHPAYGTPPGVPGVLLDEGHPVLRTQTIIDEVLASPEMPLSYLGSRQSAAEYMSDLGVLTRIAVNRADLFVRDVEHSIERLPAGEWDAVVKQLPDSSPDLSPAVRLRRAVRHPSVMAIATTAAAAALERKDPRDVREAAWWMTTSSRKELLWHASARGVSYRLWQVLSAGEDTLPRAAVLKRFSLTRRNLGGRLISPVDPSKVPAACWESVVPRSQRNGSALEAVASSAALLVTASDMPVGRALTALGLEHLNKHVTDDWNDLFAADDDGDRNFAYLLGLHQVLGAGRVPIDYARRRRIFTMPREIGRNTKSHLLRNLGEADAGHIAAHLAWFLWELLTGGDFLSGRQGHLLPGQHRRLYRNRRLRWAASQPKVFFETAELCLYRNNIDEPVSWQPELRNGMWTLPESPERHLQEWGRTARPLRKSARQSVEHLGGYSLAEAVAMASSGSGQPADRMRKDIARFLAVVEAGSFADGAGAVGASKSAISISTAKFEKALGQRLFDRGGKSASPTPAGRHLHGLVVREGLSRDVLAELSQELST